MAFTFNAKSEDTLIQNINASFVKKVVGPSTYTFEDLAAMSAAVEAAAGSEEGQRFVARSIGRNADGEMASEVVITLTFKRRRS